MRSQEESPVHIPQDVAEALLERVLQFRTAWDQYDKPDELNALLALFDRVHLRAGYALDYECIVDGQGVTSIRPYAQSLDGTPVGSEGSAAESLYPFLRYDPTPEGLFEYVFFVQELWSTRSSWHASEWLALTPIFTQRRFEETLRTASDVVEVKEPGFRPAEASMTGQGGHVRFLAHTPMGWDRIYWLEIDISADGELEVQAGDIVADLGRGEHF